MNTAAANLEALCQLFQLKADATERDLELAIDRACGIRRAKTILPPRHESAPVSVPANGLSDAIATTGRATVRPGSR